MRSVAALAISILAASCLAMDAGAVDPAPAAAQAARLRFDLGRFAVTCPGAASGTQPLAYSFKVVMEAAIDDADRIAHALPVYRDAAIVTAHGYCGFVARNARRADPSELARQIERRLADVETAARVSITLPDFIEKHLEPR